MPHYVIHTKDMDRCPEDGHYIFDYRMHSNVNSAIQHAIVQTPGCGEVLEAFESVGGGSLKRIGGRGMSGRWEFNV